MKCTIILIGAALMALPWAKIFPGLGVEILTPPALWIQIFGVGWLCGAIVMLIGGREI